MTDFSTDREKLDAIQGIVNQIFSTVDDSEVYDRLLLIDSICDVPLWKEDQND